MPINSFEIALIAALTENNIIGRDNAMPWRLPGDLRHFKALTMGKPIIMGRKTYASLGHPLKGRRNIVLTRDTDFTAPGVESAFSVDEALATAQKAAAQMEAKEIMVIGGGDIYGEFLPLADTLYLTRVHTVLTGDTSFPDIADNEWREVSRQRQERGPDDSHDYSFITLKRE